jgi:hypothetical protein
VGENSEWGGRGELRYQDAVWGRRANDRITESAAAATATINRNDASRGGIDGHDGSDEQMFGAK